MVGVVCIHARGRNDRDEEQLNEARRGRERSNAHTCFGVECLIRRFGVLRFVRRAAIYFRGRTRIIEQSRRGIIHCVDVIEILINVITGVVMRVNRIVRHPHHHVRLVTIGADNQQNTTFLDRTALLPARTVFTKQQSQNQQK